MADVYNYVALTGTIIPDTVDIQAEVQLEFQNAFGTNLNVITPSTPQALLITGESLSRIAVADNNSLVANQINPNLAGGIFLDAIGGLSGIQREPNTYTQVVGYLTGVTGTIIAAGSQAKDLNGNLYALQATLTIIAGTASGIFVATKPGPITVPINNLIFIVSNILGWETVTNPEVQISVGSDAQSDAAFRSVRNQTLALQGTALPEAIISTLLAPVALGGAGCTGVFFQENISGSTQVINGVTMVGHSIYVCATGAPNNVIAQVLIDKKSAGAAYNNGASSFPVTETIIVPFSGQSMVVLFDNPDLITILVQLTVHANSSIQPPIESIQQAILDYMAGNINGIAAQQIGESVSPFELAGAVCIENPSIFVTSCLIAVSSMSPVYAATTISMSPWQLATIAQSGISVTFV